VSSLEQVPLERMLDAAVGPDAEARRLACMELRARFPRWMDASGEPARSGVIASLTGLRARVAAGAPAQHAWRARAAVGGTLEGDHRLLVHTPKQPTWAWPFHGTAADEAGWLADLALIEAARACADVEAQAEALAYDDAIPTTDDAWVLRMLVVGQCERMAAGRDVTWTRDLLTRFLLLGGKAVRNVEHLEAAWALLDGAPAVSGPVDLREALAEWCWRVRSGVPGLHTLERLAARGVALAAMGLVDIASATDDRWSAEERQVALRAVLAGGPALAVAAEAARARFRG
jgi:hypothetical protein